jgi:hypothetical protein
MQWTATLTIDDSDRIQNKYTPSNDDDPQELNARWIMRIADKIIDGQYRFRVKSYSNDNRPNDAAIGEIIFNTDLKAFQGWNGTEWVTFG